jgi:hypothetical protein
MPPTLLTAVLLLEAACGVAAAIGPMQHLRPYGVSDGDNQKMQEIMEKDRRANAGLPPADEAAEEAELPAFDDETEQKGVPETAGPPAAASGAGGLARLGISGRQRLPIAGAGLAAAGFTIRQLWATRVAKAVDAELEALSTLTSTKRIDVLSSAKDRAALLDLRARRELLENGILPRAAKLQSGESSTHSSVLEEARRFCKKPLAQQSVAELADLNATLDARLDACGLLLAEYEALGQPPPPDFRGWGVPKIEERLHNMTVRREDLLEVVRLSAKLGTRRLDWAMPELTSEELRAHIASLGDQVSEAQARKEKAVLLGKVEAELWRRKEEAPVALATLSVPKLNDLLQRLRSGAALEG